MIAERTPTPHYRSLFWPVVLITAGLVWVLHNVGLIDGGGLVLLLRLWPLLLIVIGLDLLVGGRSSWGGGVIALGAAAIVLVLLVSGPALGLTPSVEVQTDRYTAPIEAATAANVNLNFSVGEAIVQPLDDPRQLIDADLTHFGEIEFTTTGDRTKTITLQQKESLKLDWSDWVASRGHEELRWQVGLNPQVPLDLHINGGMGDVTLNLADLELTGLRANGGAGTVSIDLPATERHYAANINGGLGNVRITVPDRADANLQINGGAGAGTIVIGREAQVVADINGGLGAFTIDVPDDAVVRVVAKRGLGNIDLPARFERVEGDAGDGSWETAGFGQAETTIVIDYKGGVGGLTVR